MLPNVASAITKLFLIAARVSENPWSQQFAAKQFPAAFRNPFILQLAT
jgi:hypothetical protein